MVSLTCRLKTGTGRLTVAKQILLRSLSCLVLFVVLGNSVVAAAPLPADELKALNYDNTFYTVTAANGCTTSANSTLSTNLPSSIPSGYADLFGKAAGVYKTNPQFLAALFMNEHSNTWLPFTGPWASSPVGASGPFQFMPGTWDAYKVDGNNDGKTDIQNIYDATYSAANFLNKSGMAVNTPLGNLSTPFAPNTFIKFSAQYNWGSGNVARNTTATSPLSIAPKETQNYMTNAYELISSGFTKGSVQNGVPTDKSNGQTTSAESGTLAAGDSCSAGVVSGNIVETALNLAWDTRGHGPNQSDAKPSYQSAMPKFNGATTTFPYSDCGVFTSTVMISSGADPDYPKRSTDVQLIYLQSSQKYREINTKNTAELAPGDVFINNSHTYLYVGPQPGGYSIVAASLYDHVPEAGRGAYFYQNGNTGQAFRIFRLIGKS